MTAPIMLPTRRRFLAASAAAVALGPSLATATKPSAPWLRQSVKAGMIRLGDDATWTERLKAARDAFFDGVEPSTGDDLDVDALKAAAAETGIAIDGTVGGYHWQIRHTDPDAGVRKEAARLLRQSIEQTAALGADTFLIVPGHGKDGDAETVRRLAAEAIKSALPLAERLGVSILIENVWNEMFYDKDGGRDQTADDLAAFVDAFGSDRVGVQFDLGNHWKYGDVADWARTLGKRIQKLDIKGYSRADDTFTDVGEGDIDWPSVRKALAAIPFTGWVAAEVKGGYRTRLTMVNQQVEDALRCSQPLDAIG